MLPCLCWLQTQLPYGPNSLRPANYPLTGSDKFQWKIWFNVCFRCFLVEESKWLSTTREYLVIILPISLLNVFELDLKFKPVWGFVRIVFQGVMRRGSCFRELRSPMSLSLSSTWTKPEFVWAYSIYPWVSLNWTWTRGQPRKETRWTRTWLALARFRRSFHTKYQVVGVKTIFGRSQINSNRSYNVRLYEASIIFICMYQLRHHHQIPSSRCP